ncbi:MAG: hypothetical protein KGD64_14425, partial [Candidatus Heimdallarchaeota archaeon]|nr:hypothetical protein [Candidatus Heimdallarchaeota archaeon]
CLGLLDSRGIIFTGSTLHKTLTTTPGPYPNSLSDLYNSISKLKKYPARYGLSGHGKIIPNVKEAISVNLRRLRWGEKSILINLKKGFSSVDDIENELIRDDNPNWQRITRNAIIANLELLIDQGKVIRRGDDYLIKNNNHTDFRH